MNQLDQHAAAALREQRARLGVNERHLVTCRASTDPAWGEPDAVLDQPTHRLPEVIDPQSDVVQRRLMYSGACVRIDGFHEIDMAIRAADCELSLSDVLARDLAVTDLLEAQAVSPQGQ